VSSTTFQGKSRARDAILMSPEAAKRLGLGSGDAIELKNNFGTYAGILKWKRAIRRITCESFTRADWQGVSDKVKSENVNK
jgi:anaerobic selenocysteine-containing dehydrogenase